MGDSRDYLSRLAAVWRHCGLAGTSASAAQVTPSTHVKLARPPHDQSRGQKRRCLGFSGTGHAECKIYCRSARHTAGAPTDFGLVVVGNF